MYNFCLLILVVAVKSETPCEAELLQFAVRNDVAGFLERLRSGKSTTIKVWETTQTLFASMNKIQELVAVRLGSKTRVVFNSSPGYASMLPALQLELAVLILIGEGSGLRMLMAAPNR